LLRVKQINLRELFSVKDVLNSKGFEILSEGEGNDLLIPIPYSPWTNHNILFEAFNENISRSELLEKINDPSFVPTSSNALNLINHTDFVAERKRYSTSFEWYIGELMVRKFSSFSASYGVEVKNILRNSAAEAKAGDYDAIAILRDINFIYFECKTGAFDRDKIFKCVERAVSLHCEFSVMMIENPISIISLKACVKGIQHPLINGSYLNEISIKDNIASKVYEWNNCFFVSAAGNIEEQMRTIMRINTAKKSQLQYVIGMDNETHDKVGYVYKSIQH
jgi:hypothetical protein